MIQVIDSFCGAGGLSLGLARSGLNVIYAFDDDIDSVKTYRRNLGDHVVRQDVKDISKSTISDYLDTEVNPDHLVLVGGPPCQGFSIQRRGEDNDLRNHLTLQYLRLVVELRPKLFLMENVGGLLGKRGQPYIDYFKRVSDHHNYSIHIKKLNASAFNVPQSRRRVFLVGERMEDSFARYSFPEPDKCYESSTPTVRDAIYDLMETNSGEIPNHIWDKLSSKNLERIRSVKQGYGRDSLPEHLKIPSQIMNPHHRHLDTYGRMLWDSPSPTITARFDSFTRGRFGHPELDRTISLREGARLQTFPDEFMFHGNKVSVARQIGNAVPPLLAERLGQSIVRFFGSD
ncbi:DNA cytosine methyltransferase [Dehalococcoidia bacterium]|nr:DNA cytosine methyltransferase [Dehalococcoidia bacterium]